MGMYSADFLIHIDEALEDSELQAMEKDLCLNEGILSACVSSADHHLMLVDYDPDMIASYSILNQVRSRGLHAELVGL